MAANILADAARKAGAPDGLINVIPTSSLPATKELMHNRGIAVILATGGTAMAAVNLLRRTGATLEHAAFVIDLPDIGGAAKLKAENVSIDSLIVFDGH